MDSIVVKVSELKALVDELSADEMQFVHLQLLEADDDLPAYVVVNGIQAVDSCESSFYGEVADSGISSDTIISSSL